MLIELAKRVVVRSSDTDVVILIILAAKMSEMSRTVMDLRSGNNKRLISVTNSSRGLEKKQNCLSETLIGFLAETGCNFISALKENLHLSVIWKRTESILLY